MPSTVLGISEAQSQLPRLIRKAESGEVCAIARHGKTVAFIISRDWVESLIETIDLQNNKPALRALRNYHARKTKFIPIDDV